MVGVVFKYLTKDTYNYRAKHISDVGKFKKENEYLHYPFMVYKVMKVE
jgi:hypothetical protein